MLFKINGVNDLKRKAVCIKADKMKAWRAIGIKVA
jgi:hypothetical protein